MPGLCAAPWLLRYASLKEVGFIRRVVGPANMPERVGRAGANRLDGPNGWTRRRSGSGAELEAADEENAATVVAHDIVAVQPVPLGVEVELPLGATMAVDGENRIVDRPRLGAASHVDGVREDRHSVEWPGREEVGAGAEGSLIAVGEGTRLRVGVGVESGNGMGAE